MIDILEKRNKATIYHANLIKPYYKRPEFINLVIEEECEEVEAEAEIPYLIVDPTQLDFLKLVKESELEICVSTEQIRNFKTVTEQHKKVFFYGQ